MGIRIVRYRDDSAPQESAWAVVEGDHARRLDATFETTGELLAHGVPKLRDGSLSLGAARPLAGLELLSPVTHPCRIIAQATNYPSHAREVGAEAPSTNVLFRKSSASITGPTDDIVRPAHVRLLDYEVELGLVIGARTRGPVHVEDGRLSELVGALVIANDVSARDVQVPEGQFYKGKSYRTFCPLGPYLYIATQMELARWSELRLTLSVNGEVRQDARAGEMNHRPAATLSEITLVEDLDPGDVVLTGTPGGVALSPPKKPIRAVGELLPEALKWRWFVEGQLKRGRYLQPGDRVTASIRTQDGELDLGTQNNMIR